MPPVGIMVGWGFGLLIYLGALAYIIGYTWTRGQYDALAYEFQQRKPQKE